MSRRELGKPGNPSVPPTESNCLFPTMHDARVRGPLGRPAGCLEEDEAREREDVDPV